MSSSGLGGCCPWRVAKRLLGLDFDDYEILNGMMTLRHDDAYATTMFVVSFL